MSGLLYLVVNSGDGILGRLKSSIVALPPTFIAGAGRLKVPSEAKKRSALNATNCHPPIN